MTGTYARAWTVSPSSGRGGWGTSIAIGLLGAVLLYLFARGIIAHRPMYDELLHVLSARGVMQTGEPVMADGLYGRAELFTRLVAASMTLFGDSLVAARLPALLSGGLLVLLVSIWTTRRVGWVAGLCVALLLASMPVSVSVAVFARFYTLHALFVALGMILAYEATIAGRTMRNRAVLAAGGMASFLAALHLQETTAIAAMAGVAALSGLFVVERWEDVRRTISKRPLMWLLAAATLVATGLFMAWRLGLLERFQSTALWAAGHAGRGSYYLKWLAEVWPLLWPLWPAALVLALLRRSREGLFCALFFLVALVAHSFAGMKASRYLYYALPFACVVLGIGADSIVAWAKSRAAEGQGDRVATAALLAALVIGVGLSHEMQRSVRFLLGKPSAYADFPYVDEPDWLAAMPVLEPLVGSAERVLVSAGVKGLYFLGRYDFEINESVVQETESGQEFGRDPRTGRQAISSADSVARVVSEPGRSLVIIEEQKLGRNGGVPPETVSLLELRCEAVEVPADARLSVWSCK